MHEHGGLRRLRARLRGKVNALPQSSPRLSAISWPAPRLLPSPSCLVPASAMSTMKGKMNTTNGKVETKVVQASAAPVPTRLTPAVAANVSTRSSARWTFVSHLPNEDHREGAKGRCILLIRCDISVFASHRGTGGHPTPRPAWIPAVSRSSPGETAGMSPDHGFTAVVLRAIVTHWLFRLWGRCRPLSRARISRVRPESSGRERQQ